MSMPIEEGCLALIFGCRVAENNGKTVTVGKRLGMVDGYPRCSGPAWEIDTVVVTTRGRTCMFIGEQRLMRIDGFKEPVESKQEEVLMP